MNRAPSLPEAAPVPSGPSRLLPGLLRALPGVVLVLSGLILAGVLATVWAGRLTHPFDLEWMEGGMLAHAWRIDQGLPVYVPPNPDFVPFVYPPGYPALVAVIGKMFGLSMTLGRAVSVAAILAAAGAIGFGVRRAGGSWPIAAASGLAFLGTYPQSGAFYDLVRPDALGIALAGWALVIGLERRPRAPIVAGLLLAAAFLTKQNAALFGVPMLLGLTLRSWRDGARFAAAALGPALLGVAALELWSGGHYLVWMLEVPASHPMAWARARVEVPREWGTALPAGFAAVTLGLVIDAVQRQRSAPAAVAAAVPLWLGMVAAWWGTYEVPPAGSGVYPVAYGTAYVALIAVPLALGVLGAGLVADRLRFGSAPGAPSWGWVYEVGLLLTAAWMALVMRVHESGFVNVHTPLFFVLALVLGLTVARWSAVAPPIVRAGLAVGLAAQLLWSAALVRRDQLVPTAADVAAGWRFVEEIRKVDGPVLSPFAAWLPVYAGKPPSLHAMGVWDCNLPAGPYFEDLRVIDRALAEHRWDLVLGGGEPLVGDLTEHYRPVAEIVPGQDRALLPRTGYLARPQRVLVPR